MALPGVSVTVGDASPSGQTSVDSGTAFVVGLTDRGSVDSPVLVRSLTDARRKIGARVPYGITLDALETFFREGGSRAYVGRVVGPDAVASSADLSDGDNPTLTVSASSPGEWGDALEVEVTVSDGEFVLNVYEDEKLVEVSPALADNSDAVSWSATSSYIRVEDLGEGNPEAQSVSLTGGDDDRTNITDEEVAAALALFASDLGTGQVLYPGATDEDSHLLLAAHAAENNRVALIDGTNTDDSDVLIAEALAITADGNGRSAALFAPWATIPGISAGTSRTVPYSAVQAGLIARSDAATSNPNIAVAGENGTARFATGLSQSYSDEQREALNDAGVTVALVKFGQVRTYGTRSLSSEDNWIQFQNVRLAAFIAAKADRVAESFLFDQIDGRGLKVAEFAGDLQGILLPLFQLGALYGATPEEAFLVDVNSVNTDETIADGELNAAIAVKMSPAAERVVIEISKVRTQEAI
jgi:hypothetical protein